MPFFVFHYFPPLSCKDKFDLPKIRALGLVLKFNLSVITLVIITSLCLLFFSYHLRVIVWNTAEVPPSETSVTGEEMSDLYLKGWLEGMEDDKEKTDVHYRSMDGEVSIGRFTHSNFVGRLKILKTNSKRYSSKNLTSLSVNSCNFTQSCLENYKNRLINLEFLNQTYFSCDSS